MARIVFTLEDGTELETELDSDVITIGRHADSIVVLPSGSVSSNHATIKRRGESYYVQDLGTTNGTRVNGVEVEEAKLEHGDQVTFGDVGAVVHLTDEAPAVAAYVPEPSTHIPANVQQAAPRVGGAGLFPAGTRGRAVGRSQARPQYKESGGCAGFLTFLFFLVLAFVVGLHVRHAVITNGGFLFMEAMAKVREKWRSSGEKATETPDASGKPADDKGAGSGTGSTPATPPAGGASTPAAPPAAPATQAAPATPGAPAMDMNMNMN